MKKLFFPQKLTFDHVALIMGFIGQGAPYIQAFKIFSKHSAEAVSLVATLISFASTFCWVVYGLSRDVKPVAFSSIFGVIGLSLVLVGIFLFGS